LIPMVHFQLVLKKRGWREWSFWTWILHGCLSWNSSGIFCYWSTPHPSVTWDVLSRHYNVNPCCMNLIICIYTFTDWILCFLGHMHMDQNFPNLCLWSVQVYFWNFARHLIVIKVFSLDLLLMCC
jgi:hypothetical protein